MAARASTACCATRPASPACRRCRPAMVDRVVELTLANRRARRRTGPAGRWPRPPASPCARCSGSGRRTGSSRTGCAASSCRRTRRSPPSCRTWSASISIRRRTPRAVGRREVPDPGARPHPARPADEEGPRRHDDPRLHPPRHDDAVRRARTCSTARVIGQCMAAAPASGVHPLPQPRRGAPCRPASWSTPSSTTTPPTSTPRSAPGSPAIRAGPSTSPRPPAPGLNAVETFFATLTRRRLQRGVFHSLVDLQAAINRYLAEHNQQAQALRLDRRSRPHHREGHPRASSDCVRPLGAFCTGAKPRRGRNRFIRPRMRAVDAHQSAEDEWGSPGCGVLYKVCEVHLHASKP